MRKINSAVCALCACVFAMLMLAGCPGGNGGAGNGAGNSQPQIATSAHMTIEGCEQGLKITLRNVRDAGINVFDGNNEIPVMLETANNQSIYYFPFTENGKQYTVKLHGEDTTTHQWFDNETRTCKALGGHKFSDCIDLSKFWGSSLTGEFTNNSFYVKLNSTQINNPSDLIKNSDFSETEFEYILCLGDYYHHDWWSGVGCNTNDFQSSGSLNNWLTTRRELAITNWNSNQTITEDDNADHGYAYHIRARLKIHFSHDGVNYNGIFTTDHLESPVYHFETPDHILATPKLELENGSGSGRVDYHRENGDPNATPVENWVHTWHPSHKGGSISLTDNTFAIANSTNTKTIDWDSFDSITFFITGGSEYGQNMNIYAEGQNSAHDNFSYDLSGGCSLNGDRLHIKVFVEDIRRFVTRNSITDDSLKIVLRSRDNADFRVQAMKFDTYPQQTESVIFNPNTYIGTVSGNGTLVNIENGVEVQSGGTKYLKVTTSNNGHDDGGYMTYDSTVNLSNALNVGSGYMRLKAECFVLESQKTTLTNNPGYFSFCFWIPMWHGEDDVGGTFLQNPNFNTKDNYLPTNGTSGDIVMYGTDLTYEAMENGFSFDSFNFWANTSGREDIDFNDLAGKTFYIGKIWAYGGSGN